MDNKVKDINVVIEGLKGEKECALQALNKVREELDFGEDLLKLRGDKIFLINEITVLRLEVEDLEKSKKKDFLFSIQSEISEFEVKKKVLSIEINEYITAIAGFKSEKILLNKTLDEISQQIMKDKAIADDAIKVAFQEIESQEARIVKRVSDISRKESEVKKAEKDLTRDFKLIDNKEEKLDKELKKIETRNAELKEGEDFALEKIQAEVKTLNEDKANYAVKVVKQEMAFSVWEDNLKLKTDELKKKFEASDLHLKEIEAAKFRIKKETEDLNKSWEEYKRQNNILKKRGK